LTEQRTLTTAVLPEAVGWSLHWHSTLEAGAEPLRITSPATRGRPGAGYSGLFWRLPDGDETRILVAEGQGEGLAHGSTGEALIVQRRHGRAWSSLVLVQDAETQGRVDPWFVRASDYVGIGPSLAWDQARDVARGESLEISLRMVMLDRRASIEEIPELLAAPADRAGAPRARAAWCSPGTRPSPRTSPPRTRCAAGARTSGRRSRRDAPPRRRCTWWTSRRTARPPSPTAPRACGRQCSTP